MVNALSESLSSFGLCVGRNGHPNSLVMDLSEDPLGIHVKEEEEEAMDVKVETKEEPFEYGTTASLPPHSTPQTVSGEQQLLL